MNKSQFVSLLGIILTASIIIFTGCKKINEATDLGDGLIPPVDNVTTFDTTVSVEAYNDLFTALTDSVRYGREGVQWLGKISNDPLFGGTDARMFFELKPTFYPYHFGTAKKDSLFIDSVVLALDYLDTYGDTLVPQTINVYEIDPISPVFAVDSNGFHVNYLIRQPNFTIGQQLGTRTVVPAVLNDSVKTLKDTTKNQFRIRLNDNFGHRLLNYDSIPGVTGAYPSDSAFKSKFRGFALQSVGGGNAVMGFNLGGVNTKLVIYYKRARGGGVMDTLMENFRFTTLSNAAMHVIRDHSSGEISGVQGGTAPDDLVYLQNSPGSFATLKIPALSTMTNRLVHRAELIVEQVYHPTDTIFPPSPYMYLDAIDPTIPATKKQVRTIPYDVTYDGTDYNRASFGSSPLSTVDGSGNKIKVWKFNISRWVQHVLTKTSTNYDLRLTMPFVVSTQYGIPPVVSDITIPLLVNETIVIGRVRVAGGTATNPQRMRLRIIYSKI